MKRKVAEKKRSYRPQQFELIPAKKGRPRAKDKAKTTAIILYPGEVLHLDHLCKAAGLNRGRLVASILGLERYPIGMSEGE